MNECSQRERQKRRGTGSSQAGQMEEERDRYGRMRKKTEKRRAALRAISTETASRGRCNGCGRVCSEQGRGWFGVDGVTSS